MLLAQAVLALGAALVGAYVCCRNVGEWLLEKRRQHAKRQAYIEAHSCMRVCENQASWLLGARHRPEVRCCCRRAPANWSSVTDNVAKRFRSAPICVLIFCWRVVR